MKEDTSTGRLRRSQHWIHCYYLTYSAVNVKFLLLKFTCVLERCSAKDWKRGSPSDKSAILSNRVHLNEMRFDMRRNQIMSRKIEQYEHNGGKGKQWLWNRDEKGHLVNVRVPAVSGKVAGTLDFWEEERMGRRTHKSSKVIFCASTTVRTHKFLTFYTF